MKTSPDLTIHLQKEKETQLLHKALQQEEAVTILFFSTEYISKTKRPEYLDRLEFFRLFQSRLVAQIPIDNPLSSYQSVSLKSILKYPILLNDASANIVELLQRYGQPEQLIFETNQSIYQEMLCQGMGLSLSLAIPFEPTTTFVSNRVRSVPIKDDIHTDCCYVLQKDARYSEVMMDFLEQMTSWFTENSYPYPSFIL